MNVIAEFENIIKLLVIGDSAVGKTNFLFRFIENQYTESHITTVGIDFKSKVVVLPNTKQKVKLQVWDTAGQERYLAVNKNLFLKVQGMILMYDITNKESFDDVDKWMESIKEVCDNIPVIFAGNKCDLDDTRMVTLEEGQQLARKYNVDFYETSGKENINVKEVFYSISETVLQSLKNKGNQKDKKNGAITLVKVSGKKKGCCKK